MNFFILQMKKLRLREDKVTQSMLQGKMNGTGDKHIHTHKTPPPVCLERGKLVAVAVTPRRTLSKQSLWGQVSVKLTPEICINNASSNSRLTAVGR
jgi:hypothetical protein